MLKSRLSFLTPVISKVCNRLIIPALLPPVSRPIGWKPETKDDLDKVKGRARYERVCNDISHNLFIWSMSACHTIKDDEAAMIGGLILGQYSVMAIRKPLP